MLRTEHKTGALRELHSEYPDDERSVDFLFHSGVSGELNILSGGPLIEGETYLLTHGEHNRRVEILKVSERYIPDAEPITDYSFRVV